MPFLLLGAASIAIIASGGSLFREQGQDRCAPAVIFPGDGTERRHANSITQYPVFFRFQFQVVHVYLRDNAPHVNVTQELPVRRQVGGCPPVFGIG